MLGPWPRRMHNTIREYEWGSTTALAELQGREPSGRPEAELWMGAHPSDPSRVDVDGTHPAGLDALITEHPRELLGEAAYRQFGARLPFLFKVLAIGHPLSLQVHPTAERARTVFEGQAQAYSEHRYVDPYAKPELIYALEPMDALSGFRAAKQAADLFTLLDGERAAAIVALLSDPGLDETRRLESALRALVTWPDADRAALAGDVAERSQAVLGRRQLDPADHRAFAWAVRLAGEYPLDPMVAAPFLLDLVRLEPGEVMFLPAGAPHAYLNGIGVEIMANSDNVLRAGLTSKPIAVEEMLHIVDGQSRPVRDVPQLVLGPHEVAWTPPVPDFRLGRVRTADAEPVALHPAPAGPQVLLCIAGPVTLCGADPSTALRLEPGQSAFVGADAGLLTMAGPGELFRATTGG